MLPNYWGELLEMASAVLSARGPSTTSSLASRTTTTLRMTEQLRENRGESHRMRPSIDALIPFIAQMSPTNPVCIPPYT